ncbi:unnamed protein product [Lactuca virosa]|uniref:Uncharacterized protein n=1 Tax=Lactuca virosa TaxID=75947 RepID=A0AAU9PKW9_9ASTR|nr:unnamed protein product [Lactuca virosa]
MCKVLSIVVKHAQHHYNVPQITDVRMAEIPRLNVGNLVFPTYIHFSYIGSIPEVMISKVPANTEVINIYKQIPKFDMKRIPAELHEIIDTSVVTRRAGCGKRKAKAVDKVVIVKPKKQRKLKKKVQPSIVDEEMDVDVDETTISDVYVESDVQNKEDDAKSLEHPQKKEQPTTTAIQPTTEILKVSENPQNDYFVVDDNLDDDDDIVGDYNNTSFEVFVQHELAPSLLDDETTNMPINRKDYKALNKELKCWYVMVNLSLLSISPT